MISKPRAAPGASSGCSISARWIEALRAAIAASALCAGCSTDGEALLRDGAYVRLLNEVRPLDAESCRLRALAWRGLSRPGQARTALRMSLLLDGERYETHRLLGFLEAQRGAQGAALRHFQRALELEPGQPEVAAAVARLLLRRAWLRADATLGMRQQLKADADARRAVELDPTLKSAALEVGRVALAPGTRRHPRDCPGIPPIPARRPLPRDGACAARAWHRSVRLLEDRYLLAGCAGARLALAFERRGCLPAARRCWQLLAEQMPLDSRWPLQLARIALAAHRPHRADVLLLKMVYLAADLAGATLDAGHAVLQSGQRAKAAQRAIDALALAERLQHRLGAVELLVTSGHRDQAQRAARDILRRADPGARDRLRRRLGELGAVSINRRDPRRRDPR